MKTNGRHDEQYKGGAERQPPPHPSPQHQQISPSYFENENENRISLFDLQDWQKNYSHPCTDLDRTRAPQEVEAFRIFRHYADEDGKVVSTKHWPLLPPK